MSRTRIGLTDKEVWRYEDLMNLLIPLIGPKIKQQDNFKDRIRGLLVEYESAIGRLKKKDIPNLAKIINIVCGELADLV